MPDMSLASTATPLWLSGPVAAIADALSRDRRRQVIEAAVLEILIESPALDLIHHLVEFRSRNRLIHEALAAAEAGEIPCLQVLELGRHGKPPQRQIFFEIGVERRFGAVERAQIGGDDLRRRAVRHPPERMK